MRANDLGKRLRHVIDIKYEYDIRTYVHIYVKLHVGSQSVHKNFLKIKKIVLAMQA